MIISFEIPGPPRTLQRARFGHGRTYDPPQNVANKAEIVACYRAQTRTHPMMTGPLRISIGVYKRTAKKQMGWLTARPDIDNMAKLILDALNGVVYEDDAQVCSLHIEKQYDARNLTRVVISELEE